LNPAPVSRHHEIQRRSQPPDKDLKPSDQERFNSGLQKAWSLHQAGQLAAAEQQYLRLLASQPNQPDALNLMGLLCIQAGRPSDAEPYILKALRTDPDNPQSHYNLGIACAHGRRFAEAARHFGRAAELQPGNVEALSSQGNALRLAGQPEAALNVLRAALGIEPRHPGARQNLALALNDAGAERIRAGDTAQAIDRFREALRISPEHAQAHLNLGLTLEQSGQLEQAARCYQAAIRARPDFADPHFHLAHLRSHRSSSAEIDAMRKLIERPGCPRDDQAKLAFGLGFALESVGDFKAAFEAMSEGHRLQSLDSGFSLQREAQRFRDVKRAFPADHPALKTARTKGEQAIFITGLPRSGTTLAEQVLASHSLVEGGGESTALMRLAKQLGWPFGGDPTRLDVNRLRDEGAEFLDRLTHGSRAVQRFVDTTPMNFPYLGLAALMLPGARFVHCLRHPMDNGLSIFRQYLTGPWGFEHGLRDLGGFYRLHLDLTDHWQTVLADRLYILRYERLVHDAEAEIRRLLDFMGLPFDRSCLEFHQTDRVVRSPSAGQVRQPLYASSIGAWKRYAEYLQPLADALVDPELPGRRPDDDF